MKLKRNPNQKGLVIWLFGLSGAGKTTISSLLKEKLESNGFIVATLDGDVLRTSINKDLSFSEADRRENLRRAAEIARIMSDNNMITICSFITPLEKHRTMVSDIIGDNYFEVFVDCPLDICADRDVKGLYKKAKANQILDFTGIGSRFETPENPHMLVSTAQEDPNQIMEKLYCRIISNIRAISSKRENALSLQ